jgi:uncharacterized phage protein (TIGR01671 family)
MRDYKFRGKRVDNGEWVYGGYTYDRPQNSHYIIDFDEGYLEEVIPESVGMSTNLKDKPGKEIWEGDVVKKSKWDFIWIVEFKKGGFVVTDKSGFSLSTQDIKLKKNILEDCEVIGDIFSTPDLLKEKK